MSKESDLIARLRTVSEESFAHDDADVGDAHITRRSAPARVYSLRLSSEEVTQLEREADRLGVAPSALARRFISEGLAHHADTSPEGIAAELLDLSRRVTTLAES